MNRAGSVIAQLLLQIVVEERILILGARRTKPKLCLLGKVIYLVSLAAVFADSNSLSLKIPIVLRQRTSLEVLLCPFHDLLDVNRPSRWDLAFRVQGGESSTVEASYTLGRPLVT